MTESNQTLPVRYCDVELYYENRFASVYLASDSDCGGEKRLIKVIGKDTATSRLENIIRFKSEISIASRLNHPNIIRVIDFGELDDRYFIVVEHVRGRTLDEMLKETIHFSIEEALEVMQYICGAVLCLHDNGIIHRGINPASLVFPMPLMTKNFKVIKLSNAGVSHLKDVPFNDPEESSPENSAYLSPEQCGLVKGVIDERSDIYSLGVLLYHLLTGDPLVKHDSVHGQSFWVRQEEHVGSESYHGDIPDILGKIIMRMTDQDPDKRYQSVVGVQRDLDLYMRGYRNYALGEHDSTVRFTSKTPLIGRKEELNLLVRMHKNSLKGFGGICLISGSAGTGKTRLVKELEKNVSSRGGIIFSGKFYQSADSAPYGPFREFFSFYVERFMKKPEWEKREIAEKIKKELLPFGEILCQFSPSVKPLLGDVPKLVELEPDRESRRYLMVISSFIRIISEAERALIISLDNIHFIDNGSLLLLLEILQNIGQQSVLIIGTYRHDEVEGEHLLKRLIEHGKSGNYPHNEIRLQPFSEQQMQRYVISLLSQEGNDVAFFADIIQRKAKGNPLFAFEIIKELIQNGAVSFGNNRWNFSFDAIDKLNIPEGVLEIILKRVELLTEVEKYVISYATAMGKLIDVDLFADVMLERKKSGQGQDAGYDAQDIVMAIDHAVGLQILEEDSQKKGFMLFTHKKIRDHFDLILTAAERISLHASIARKIFERTAKESDSLYYDLTFHYSEARDHANIINYAFIAGLIAKSNYAYELAVNYFNQVIRSIEENRSFAEDAVLMKKWISCNEEIGGICLTIGEIEKGIDLYRIILQYKNTPIEKAAIYRQICMAYFKIGNWTMSEEYGRKGLQLLGESLPIGRFAVLAGIVRGLIRHSAHVTAPYLFLRMRTSRNNESERMKIWLYVSTNWMYILSDVAKFTNAIIRMLNISESRIGKSRELAMSLSAFASMLMAAPRFSTALRYHNRAVRMKEKLGDQWGLGQSYQWLGYCHSWMGNYSKSNEMFVKSLGIYRGIGDLWETGMNIGGLFTNYYQMSNYEKANDYAREYKIISSKLSDYYGLSRSYQSMAWCMIEKGDFDGAEDYINESIQICAEKRIYFNLCVSNIEMGVLYCEKNDHDRALQYFREAEKMDMENSFIKEYTALLYIGIAECSLKKMIRDKSYDFTVSREDVSDIKKACLLALAKTARFVNNRAYALRIYAEFNDAVNRPKRAESMYLKSIQHAMALGRRYEQARSLMSYGLFCRRRGNEAEAVSRLKAAHSIFTEIGAQGYASKLSEMFGVYVPEKHSSGQYFDHQRLAAIMMLGQDISSILDLDELLEQILNKAVEVTGAQRGYLFIRERGEDNLELKASINLIKSDIVEYSRHVVDEVFQTREPVITTNAERNEKYSIYQSVVKSGLKSILCLPIKHYDKIVGVCYLDNPIKRGAFSERDAVVLGIFMAQSGIAIENAYYYKELEKKVKDRTRELNSANEELGAAYSAVSDAYTLIKEDMTVARSVQESMLPREVAIPGADFCIHYYPVSEVGGDIYDINRIDDSWTRIFICDATGHGIQAALTTMVIKSEYDAVKHQFPDPSEALAALNRSICTRYKNLQIVFTCAVIDIMSSAGKLVFSCAGHVPQYLIRNDSVVSLEKTGRIIGLIESSVYTKVEHAIGPGDRLLIMTDGLFEQFNDNKAPYGEKRMIEAIGRNRKLPVEGIIKALFDDISLFIGPGKTINSDDDTTVIGVSIAGPVSCP